MWEEFHSVTQISKVELITFLECKARARNLYFGRQSDRESGSAGVYIYYRNRKFEAKDFEKAYSIFIDICW